MEKATFGGGCFWGVEEAFRKLKGVLKTTVGYAGGSFDNPSYENVCTGKTGHIEVVQIQFDPLKITYEKLLDIFWHCHDPTQLHRQGPDIGVQYSSVIFYHTQVQKKLAEKSKEKEQKKYTKRIVTEILVAPVFYKAEEYHQHYLEKRGLATCHI